MDEMLLYVGLGVAFALKFFVLGALFHAWLVREYVEAIREIKRQRSSAPEPTPEEVMRLAPNTRDARST